MPELYPHEAKWKKKKRDPTARIRRNPAVRRPRLHDRSSLLERPGRQHLGNHLSLWADPFKRGRLRGTDRPNHGRRARIARYFISLESVLVLGPDQSRPLPHASGPFRGRDHRLWCPDNLRSHAQHDILSLATAFLESRVLHAIEMEGVDAASVTASVYMAPNSLDYSPEFYEAMKRTLALGSKLWTEYEVPINVRTPIIDLSKAEIVALGMKFGAPLGCTWSCYEGGENPCGSCDSCILRAKGFAEAGVPDPLLERLGRA